MTEKVLSPLILYMGTKRNGKNKTFSLNLNIYRNTNPFLLGQAKEFYTNLLEPVVSQLPVYNKVKLTYTLYPKTTHRQDLMNICSIVDKFFSDVLVKCKRVEDDSYEYIPEVTCKIGKVDKINPRVEIEIEEYNG